MEKILIVDDSPMQAAHLKDILDDEYEITIAQTAEEGLRQASTANFSLILLDVVMPGMDGFTLLKKLQEEIITQSIPVILITSLSDVESEQHGLILGAVDYIVKPFSLVELEARIQAHLRREVRSRGETQVKFSGDLTIDYSERTLFLQNEKIPLAKKEFDIVELLSQNAGQVFDKERIYERVWGFDSDGDSSVVAEHIRRIRSKLSAHTGKTYIETVWGCGYKWSR